MINISTTYSSMPSWCANYEGTADCTGSEWETILVIKQATYLADLLLRASAAGSGQMRVIGSLDGESGDIDVVSAFAIGTTDVIKSAYGFFAPVLLVQAKVAGTVTLQIAAR